MTPNESVINGIDILRKDPLVSRTSVAALDCEQLRGQRQKRRGSLPSRSRHGRRSFPQAPSQPATRHAKETSNQSPLPTERPGSAAPIDPEPQAGIWENKQARPLSSTKSGIGAVPQGQAHARQASPRGWGRLRWACRPT